MDNTVIKERWNQIQIDRFSKLVRLGYYDELDLLNIGIKFFNMETFVDDFILNYKITKAEFTNWNEKFGKKPIAFIYEEYNIMFLFDFSGLFKMYFKIMVDAIKKIHNVKYVRVFKDIVSDSDKEDISDVDIVEYNLNNVLNKMYLSDEIKNRYLAIEEKYKNKIDFLYNKGLKEFISNDEYKEGFVTYLVEFMFEKQSVFSDSDIIEKVVAFLMDKRDDYIYLIYTGFYANGTVKKLINNKVDIVDYSYASLTMFKMIEKLLYEICVLKYPHEKFKNDIKIVNMDERKMMLSDMADFLEKKEFINSELYNRLKSWIKYDRNGYAHKHIMNKEAFDECACNTYNLFFELINLIVK